MKSIKNLVVVAFAAVLFAACSAPKNLVYYPEVPDLSVIQAAAENTIALQPQDKLSIIVSSREPQIAAMFNLSYYANNVYNVNSTSYTGGNYSGGNQRVGYTIDSKGDIDFPILGKIHAAGLSREKLAESIKQKLIASNQIKDPIVTVEYINLAVTMLGEVSRPGRFAIDRDHFTILDAIGVAGDLTILGDRTNVAVVRRNGNDNILYRVDLTDPITLYASPAFNVQQGDLIYVTPNKMRQRQSTVNGNNFQSVAFWMSLASFLTSMAVFVKNW